MNIRCRHLNGIKQDFVYELHDRRVVRQRVNVEFLCFFFDVHVWKKVLGRGEILNITIEDLVLLGDEIVDHSIELLMVDNDCFGCDAGGEFELVNGGLIGRIRQRNKETITASVQGDALDAF